MFALNIYQENLPPVVLTFKTKDAAETVEQKITGQDVSKGFRVHDSFGASFSGLKENIESTLIVDIEADMDRSIDLEIMRAKAQIKASEKMSKDPAFALRNAGIVGAPFMNGIPKTS